MSESITTEERMQQRTEELAREIAEKTTKPAMMETVTTAVVPSLETLNARVDSLVTLVENLPRTYVTQDDMDVFVRRIGTLFDEKLDAIRKENERKFAAERELTNRQLAGYVQVADYGQLRDIVRGNVAEVAAVKAAHDERLKSVENGLKEARETQATTSGNVETIARTVETIKDSAEMIQRTYAEEIERDRKRQEDVDREFKLVKDNRLADVAEMRRIEGVVNREAVINRDLEQRVLLSQERQEIALYGNPDKKEPGVIADVRELKRGLSLQSFLFGTPIGRVILAGAWFATVYLAGHPEIIPLKLPFG